VDWDKKEDKDILNIVLERFEKAAKFRRPHEEKWLRWYKLYRSYTEKREVGANLFIPYTFSIVESVQPRLVTTLFASRPYIGVLPLRPDMVTQARNMENLLDYQLIQRINIVEVASQWIKEALIYGTSIIKVGWRFETKKTRTTAPLRTILGVPVGSKVVEQETVVYDDPKIEHIDLWDFYVDPEATSIDDAEYCIHRIYRTKEHLKKLADAGIYKNIDKVEIRANIINADLGAEERRAAVGLGTVGQTDRIELIEYWEDDRIITVANRAVVIRNEPNPFWHGRKPFVRLVDQPVPHEFYGIGEIEPIEYLQLELNDTRNQRMDNVNLVLNRMWKVLRSADIDPAQLVSRPGGFVEVDDMNDIEPLEFIDVTSSSYKEEEEIKRDIDRTTGVYDYARGETTDRRETATTASILSSAANERFKLKIQLMEDMGLRRLGSLLVQLNQQFIDKERVIRILGPDGMFFNTIGPDDIKGQFDVMAIGSTVEPVVNRDARLNQLTQLYANLQGSPYINHPEFIKKILEVANLKDTDRLVLQQQPMASGAVDQQTVPPDMLGAMLGGAIDETQQ